MQWSVPREAVIPTKIDFKNLFHKGSNPDRNALLKQHNYTCRGCGGHYKSYLIITYIEKDNCYDLYCVGCNNLTHLNTGVGKAMAIYHSKLSQLEILRKSVENVISVGKIPSPIDIDPDALQVQLSLFEYVNLLDHDDKNIMGEYKIFFTHNFNTTFITHNYGDGQMLTVDDEPIPPEFPQNIPTCEFSNTMLTFLNQHL